MSLKATLPLANPALAKPEMEITFSYLIMSDVQSVSENRMVASLNFFDSEYQSGHVWCNATRLPASHPNYLAALTCKLLPTPCSVR